MQIKIALTLGLFHRIVCSLMDLQIVIVCETLARTAKGFITTFIVADELRLSRHIELACGCGTVNGGLVLRIPLL